jgi:ATP-binding cassette subfamily B multidrug efflux pump
MSEPRNAPAGPRPGGPRPGGFRGPGGGHGLSMPVEKPKNFLDSGKRLLSLLRPHRAMIAIVIALGVVSVACSISGPKLLGNATTVLFTGVISKGLPAGVTQAQVIAGLQAKGQTQLAQMLSGMTLTPGVGVDFTALRNIALLLALVYLLSAVFSWLQQYLTVGISQGIVYELRNEVSRKLAKLPLRYFDSHARGDILSRVTNDIDNIANTLQQSLTQIITSVLTIIGVLGMMFWINWLLAGISLLTVPISVVVTVFVAKRSQKQFALQWERTGDLNGHVEEMHTGRNIVKVFGREKESEAVFDEKNDKLYQASFKAQFISGIRRQPELRVGRRDRRREGRLRHAVARRRAGVHPVLEAVHVADHAGRKHHERDAVGGRFSGARVRAARRDRGERGARDAGAADRVLRPHRARGRVVPLRG